MAIPSKQIGWSQESNILHEIAKQLYKIGKFTGGTIGPTAITGLGAPDEVVFFTAAQAISGNANLFWRNPLSILSIGDDTVATQTLDVTGRAKATSYTIVNGGDIITPSAGNINIPGNLGLGVTVGTDPTQRLDVAGNIRLRADLGYGMFGTESVGGTPIWSFGTVDTLGGQPNDDSLSINALGGLSFGEGGAALNFQQNIVIYPTTGNVVVQNGGVFSDTGEKLKVTGNTLIDGNLVTTNSSNRFSGTTTSSLFGFTLYNSSGSGGTGIVHALQNNNIYYIAAPFFRTTVTGTQTQQITFRGAYAGSITSQGAINFSTYSTNLTQTSGVVNFLRFDTGYATSGPAVPTAFRVDGTINQNNVATGRTRGIYINPTFPNPPADYRAIETLVNIATAPQAGRPRYQWQFLNAGKIFVGNNSAEVNFIFSTGIGTKFGAATTHKFAFWNAVSIGQPVTSVASATYVDVASTIIKTSDTFDGYTFGQVVKALRNMGLLA
jgi:hypothetical protein